MANAFDFQLKADDQVSAAIQRIEDAVNGLNPLLGKTTDSLKLGGSESVDGLDSLTDRLSKMSVSARDNVQFIGDMVPPLKMVGELGGKLGGALRFGAAGVAMGVVAGGIGVLATKLHDASREAYDLDVSAKNAGMRVDDFSRLSGAMQILGADAGSANQSVGGLFTTFNEALQGRNGGVLGALTQIGVQIEKNKNGTADVTATMQKLAQVLPTLAPENQKTVADAIGLDDNGLMLLREGVRLKELLSKSDKFGLTVDPELNNDLTGLNGTINELGAAWDGLIKKTKAKIFEGLLSDGSVKDGLEGVTDVLTNGLDSISLGHVVGLNRGKEAEQLRWAYNNPEFYETLSVSDKAGVELGYMTDGFREKYNAQQKPINAVNQLQNDMKQITAPAGNVNDRQQGSVQEQARLSQLEAQHNLPKGLLDRIWAAESARGKKMTSPVGAEGHFQFMPATGRDYGLNNREDRMDFTKSSDAAAKYLSNLLKMFNGDVKKAVAAYNWGPGRVGNLGLDRAPAETRNYLQKIMPGLPLYQPQEEGYVLESNGVAQPTGSSSNAFQQENAGAGGIIDNQRSDTAGQVTASIITPDATNQGSANHLSEVISKAITDNKFQLEVTLINSQTGERQSVNADGGGRVALPMQFNS